MHHFIAISEFWLELQSRKAQFGSKSTILFLAVWPWNLTDDLDIQYGTSSMLLRALYIISKLWVYQNLSYSPELLNLCQSQPFFVPCDLEIWRMTLKNNSAPLLCCFKLCASFHSHQWILTGVTVWKLPFWVKIDDFLSHVTLKYDRWPWKIIGHIVYATSSFVHHFKAIR